MEWLEPWCSLTQLGPQFAPAFEHELDRELSPGHPLFGITVAAIGKRDGTDDVLFRLDDGTGRVAVVHLTYCNQPESPPWPSCILFHDLQVWSEQCMRPDHHERNG